MVERKLDIFKVLDATNAKNRPFYEKLSPEERKGFVPSVTARWMTGTNDAAQVVCVNEFVNPYTFSLYKHPQLLWQLMTAANSGSRKRYAWNKLPGKNSTGKSNTIKVIMEYFDYSPARASEAVDMLTREQVMDMAADLGWQPDEVAKIKKEMKASKGAASKEDPVASLLEF